MSKKTYVAVDHSWVDIDDVMNSRSGESHPVCVCDDLSALIERVKWITEHDEFDEPTNYGYEWDEVFYPVDDSTAWCMIQYTYHIAGNKYLGVIEISECEQIVLSRTIQQ